MENKSEPDLPSTGKKGGGGTPKKFVAIIVALLLVIVALGTIMEIKPVFTGSNSSISVATPLAVASSPFSVNITTNGAFKNVTVFWGDGTTSNIQYGGSDHLDVQHTYSFPGTYYLYYVVNFGSKTYSSIGNMVKVDVSTLSQSQNAAAGFVALSKTTSSSPIANTTGLFDPGANLSYVVGYATKPLNSSFSVFSQVAYLYRNNTLVQTYQFPYNFNTSSQSYELPLSRSNLNISDAGTGFYALKLNTLTGTLLTGSRNTTTTVTNVTEEQLAAGNAGSFQSGSSVSNLSGITFLTESNTTFAQQKGTILDLTQYSNLTFKNNTVVHFNDNGNFKENNNAAQSFSANTNYTMIGGASYNFTTAANFTTLNGSSVSMLRGSGVTLFTDQATVFDNQFIFYIEAGSADVSVSTQYEGTVSATIQNGGIDNSNGIYQTTYYLDIPVFSGAGLLTTASASELVHSELANGAGYLALDPALAQDSGSEELQMNTMQSLVVPAGSSSTSFHNLLASALPSLTNGGINTNYSNYTVTNPSGISYKVSVSPYQNYTFHVRSNASWQNGQPVTSWDVMYSIARVLLYDNEVATTPGYIFAPSLLPGNYLTSNTFWNITQNITVNNQTNNITFHFQHPISPQVAFEMFSGPGSYIVDPAWFILHGDGLNWTPSGFQSYKSTGNNKNWNFYVTHNTFSDGPYMIQQQQIGSDVVLVKNPHFTSPGPWFPAASIGVVKIQYIGTQSTIYLELRSKQSQISTISTNTWTEAEQLNQSGIDTWVQYPTLLIYPAFINAHVGTASLSKLVNNANIPSELFSSMYVRKTFAYAFNYPYFLKYQLNNPSYKGVNFGIFTGGILQKGLSVSENVSQLNKSTNGQVPYFSLSQAASYWQMFMSQQAYKLGITNSSNGPLYKGSPLVIPIFVQQSFAAGSAAISTWSTELEKIIPNIQLVPVPLPIGEIIGYFLERPNPMPIWIAGWAPENANAYGNIEPLAAPNNGSQIMPADSFLPYWFENSSNPLHDQQQAQNLTKMLTLYNNSQTSAVQSVINSDFLQMNNIYVNLTVNVYLFQAVDQWVIANNINAQQMAQFDENPVLNAYNILYYNWVSYG